MKKPIFIACIFLLLCGCNIVEKPQGLKADVKEQLPPQAEAHKNLKFAPDFKLRTPDSRTVALSGYRGNKVVVLMFWTTECPVCVEQLAELNYKYADILKSGVELLAVNAGESARKVGRFTRAHPLLYPVLLDEDASVSESFGLMGVPTYILVDKDGYIVFDGYYFPENEYRQLNAK